MLTTKVILIEDDPGIREALEVVFERAGITATIFADATPVLQGDFEVPDIFIIDKQLSGVDGLDVCRFLKRQEGVRHIPVIMMSASPDIAAYAADACADDYLEKPFKNSVLLSKIQQLTVIS